MMLLLPKLSEDERAELLRITDPVEGWLNIRERTLLYSLGKTTQAPILELGCYKGKSTVCFLLGRKRANIKTKHVVIDLFGDYGGKKEDFEETFRRNVAPWVGETDLHVLRLSTFVSEPVLNPLLKKLGEPSFGGIFIDADHTYASVVKDAHLAHGFVQPNGWLAFHDALKYGAESVLPACLDCASLEGYKLAGTYPSILLLQKFGANEQALSWKQERRIAAYSRWNKTPLAALVDKTYVLLARSALRKQFLGTIKAFQKAFTRG